jgi:hypothetical protein
LTKKFKTPTKHATNTTPRPAEIGSGTTTPEDSMQRRLTDDEQKKLRDAWEILSQIRNLWDEINSARLAIRLMFEQNTTDGLPYVEPPLTDEDARQRPWVMVRDTEVQFWKGPRKFAAKAGQFYVFSFPDDALTSWNFCRRATASEIAAAGLEVAE